MKTIFTLILLSIGFRSFSQNPTIQWEKSLGGSGMDFSNCIQQTSDGGYIIAGQTSSNDGDVTGNHGGGDYWVVKLDINGLVQWEKSFGGTGGDIAYSVLQTADGGYLVGGTTTSPNGDVIGNYSGFKSLWIIKLDVAGSIQWQNIVLGSFESCSIQKTSDGGYIASAGFSIGSGVSDFSIIKLDSIGNMQWTKAYGGTKDDASWCIQQTSDHGYIIGGTTNSMDGDVTGNHGLYDYWVVKTDSMGVLQWQKTLGGTKDDYANSIVQSNDGGYVIAGISRSNDGDVSANFGLEDYWIVKLGPTGNLQWEKNYGGSGDDQAFWIRKTSANGYAVGGAAYTFNDGDVSGSYGNGDYWLLRIDSVGNKLGQIAVGGTSIEESRSITQTTDGGYAMTGYSYSNDGDVTGHHGLADFWVVKLDATVGIVENKEATSTLAIYPNPATNKISVDNNHIFASKPIVTIRDCFGALILSGNAIKEIDVSGLKSGCYFLQLEGDNTIYHSKFIKE